MENCRHWLEGHEGQRGDNLGNPIEGAAKAKTEKPKSLGEKSISVGVESDPLKRLQELWGLSVEETARIFEMPVQEFTKWLQDGVPVEGATAVGDLDTVTQILENKLKRERIPAIVRRAAPSLDGKSIYEMACEGRYREVREAVRIMFALQSR